MSFFRKAAVVSALVAGFGLAASQAYAKVVKVELEAKETGWVYNSSGDSMDAFTYNGAIPGPVVRVTEGDEVDFTLKNDAGNKNSHSIDFHAARVNVLDEFAPIKPGDTKTFKFPTTYPGVFFYHCGASPMQEHIARGMFGVIIVDPKKDTRPKADREYVLIQSEIYDDPKTLQNGTFKHVVFNGKAFRYDPVHDPKGNWKTLVAKPGERVRLYVVNAGPHEFSAIHPIAGIWDKVWPSGNPKNELVGLQTYTVAPGDASTFDIISPVPGGNAIVTHSLKGALTGAIAVIVFDPKLPATDKSGKEGNLVVP